MRYQSQCSLWTSWIMYCILLLEQSQMATAKITCPCSRQEELHMSLLSEKQEFSQKFPEDFFLFHHPGMNLQVIYRFKEVDEALAKQDDGCDWCIPILTQDWHSVTLNKAKALTKSTCCVWQGFLWLQWALGRLWHSHSNERVFLHVCRTLLRAHQRAL